MRRALILLAAFSIHCTSSQVSSTKQTLAKAETAVAAALISDQDEQVLGEEIRRELERGSPERPAIRYSNDPVVRAYVEGLMGKLITHSNRDRKAAWQVAVIDDPNTVNAFATPGAYIYVYSGLLMAADTEAEVVGVLAHEIGHVVARHSARQIVNIVGLNAIAGLVLGENPGMLEQVVASVVGQGTMLAHSRGDEYEADQYAVHYSAAADYDPTGIATFFQKLNAKQGYTLRALTWLSTHPTPADRVQRVNQTIAGLGFGGKGEVGAERLAPIKQRIASRISVSAR